MRIQIKLVSLVMLLAIIGIIIVSYAFFFQGLRMLGDRIENQLESVVILKENQLSTFIRGEIVSMEAISDAHELTDHILLYHTNLSLSDVKYNETISDVRDFLSREIKGIEMTELFLILLNGEVHISTYTENEGKIKIDKNYFLYGLNETYMESYYHDPITSRPISTIASPIKHDNITIGLMAGNLNLTKISEIMTERSGLGNTGETYLVNRYNLLLTSSRFIEDAEFRTRIQTDAVKDCIKGNSNHLRYQDYRGEYVIGYYKWIPDMDVCIIAKIDQSEAFNSMIDLIYSTLYFEIVALVFLVIFWWVINRIMVKPIVQLRDFARNVGKGELHHNIDIRSHDEIGELANAFNQMTRDLKISREKIRKHTDELEDIVEERTKNLNDKIKELTNTKTAMINMMNDMDETNMRLIKTQNQLKNSLKDLKLMSDKKNEFISIAAHELKTPLTSIHGFSQLLQNDSIAKDISKRQKYLKIMDQESRRLATLVSDMLDLSRIDLGTFKLIPEKVNIMELMNDIKKEMVFQMNKKDIKGTYIISNDIPLVITDKDRLMQILINLITNSVKYTPNGGYITISANREINDVHFIIKDTGIGIAKNQQEKIFQRFYQVDSSYSRSSGGTGLGLSVCKEIVAKLNGKIWVKSKLKHGSEFHFTIPIKSVIQ